MPKFSIIIPVYNVEAYLVECLDSVFSQTFTDLECIIVNDGSTDHSYEIACDYIKSHKLPITNNQSQIVLLSQQNAGLSSARNAGMAAAHGDYLLFLDSDDRLSSPDALASLAAAMNHNLYDIVGFTGRRFKDGTSEFSTPEVVPEKTYASGMDYFADCFMRQSSFSFVSVVLRAYRREYLQRCGLTFAEGIYHEDNRFTPLACYYAGFVHTANLCIYDYRYRESSITTIENPKRRNDLVETANYLAEFFTSKRFLPRRRAMYRAICLFYQKAIQRNADKSLVNWWLYYRVSRTKLRHRINFFINRFSRMNPNK